MEHESDDKKGYDIKVNTQATEKNRLENDLNARKTNPTKTRMGGSCKNFINLLTGGNFSFISTILFTNQKPFCHFAVKLTNTTYNIHKCGPKKNAAKHPQRICPCREEVANVIIHHNRTLIEIFL